MASYRKSGDVREQLLDVAEQLFARHGYFGTSVRDITDAAGLRLASINYHFGSKDELLGHVIARRAEPLGKKRLDRLAHATEATVAAKVKLKRVVEAFVKPMIEQCLTGGPGWRHYFVLVAQLSTLQVMVESERMDQFDEVAVKFIQAFRHAPLTANMFAAHCAFQFMLGTSLFAVCDNKRLDRLSKGKFHSGDLETIAEPLVLYIAGGIAELVRKTA